MRNLKIRYRKSFFGMAWTVLVPAASAIIYHIVFQFVLKVKIDHYLVHILTGLIPWTFFATTVAIGLETIVANHGLLNKVPLPAHALVLAEAATSFLNFLLSIPVLLVVMLLMGVVPQVAFLQLLPLSFLLFLITYAITLALSLAFVYFRDLRYLTNIVIQFWFYLTPIMYIAEMIPLEYKHYTYLNPLFEIFDCFHKLVVGGAWIGLNSWLIILAWVLVALTFSWWLLKRVGNGLVEIL